MTEIRNIIRLWHQSIWREGVFSGTLAADRMADEAQLEIFKLEELALRLEKNS